MSKICDSFDSDGNTISVFCDDNACNEYVFCSEFGIIKFTTQEKIIYFISLLGNNMMPTATAAEEKNIYFISELYKFIENEGIEEGTLIISKNVSVDPNDYQVVKCGEGVFKTLECN